MSLNTTMREAAELQQVKEDENTWSKVNDVLSRMCGMMKSVEDARTILKGAEELIIRSMQSDRSKLAGTALNLIKNCMLVLGSEFTTASMYLTPLIKVCGKSNRVFYSRGEEVLVVLCKSVNIRPYLRFFNEYSTSMNKNVRLAVFKGIEGAFSKNGRLEEFEGMIARGRSDPSPDAREVCRRIISTFGIDTERIYEVSGGKPGKERFNNGAGGEPVRTIRQPFRPNFIPDKSIVQQAAAGKKELTSRFSPMRKQTKVSDGDCDKIRELEEQVRSIAEDITPDFGTEGGHRASSRHEPIRMKSRIQAASVAKTKSSTVHPDNISIDKFGCQDDLTPVRLDRYLNKYRREYGEAVFKRECMSSNREDGVEEESPVRGGEEEMLIGDHRTETASEACSGRSECSLIVEGDDIDSTVSELSKNLANFSITRPDTHSTEVCENTLDEDICMAKPECTDGETGLSTCEVFDDLVGLDGSVNPYENLEVKADVDQTLKHEYTIVNSVSQMEDTPKSRYNLEEDALRMMDGGCRESIVFEDVQGSSIHESTIVVDSPLKKSSAMGKCTSGPKEMKREFSTTTGNRFSGFLYLSESSGEETVFSNPSCDKRASICDDVNLSFADRVTPQADGGPTEGIFKENSGQVDSSKCFLGKNGIVGDKASSLLLHESMNLLRGIDENGSRIFKDIGGEHKHTGDAVDEDGDFTAVDSFIQIKRSTFRKNKTEKQRR